MLHTFINFLEKGTAWIIITLCIAMILLILWPAVWDGARGLTTQTQITTTRQTPIEQQAYDIIRVGQNATTDIITDDFGKKSVIYTPHTTTGIYQAHPVAMPDTPEER